MSNANDKKVADVLYEDYMDTEPVNNTMMQENVLCIPVSSFNNKNKTTLVNLRNIVSQEEVNPQLRILIQANDIYNVKQDEYVTISPVIKGDITWLQWYDESGHPLVGKNEMHLTIGPIDNKDLKQYYLRAENNNQMITTRLATVSNREDSVQYNTAGLQPAVIQNKFNNRPPRILNQSQSGVFNLHSKIDLFCQVENATHYQWYKDNNKISGSNSNTLTIQTATMNDTGSYKLHVINSIDHLFSNLIQVHIA